MAAECWWCESTKTTNVEISGKGLVPMCAFHKSDFAKFRKNPMAYLKKARRRR